MAPSHMSHSPEQRSRGSPSPSPLGPGKSTREASMNGSNGFTAVNNRTSPNSGSRARTDEATHARASLDRPKAQQREGWPAPESNGSGAHAPNPVANGNASMIVNLNGNGNGNGNGAGSRSASPLKAPGKRKRAPDEIADDVRYDGRHRSASSSPEDNDDSRHNYSQPPSAGDPNEQSWNSRQSEDHSEAQLAHALQRDINAHEAMSGSTASGYQEEYSGMVTTNAGVQVDPKKRKRAFTNRTKTGCQTCRRRKKKCDEGKPECNNCSRGGFVCEGYAAKSTWPKTAQKLPPMAIQSKETYGGDASIYPSIPYTESPHPPHEGGRGRPLLIDDEPERALPNSNAWSNSPYSASHLSYSQDRGSSELSHGLPLSAHLTQMRDYPDRSMPPTLHSGMSGLHGHSTHSGHSPVIVAQRALQQPTFSTQTEKERMALGEPYNPFDKVLVDEREKCKAALHNFNTNQAVSTTERTRLFRNVIEPADSPRPSYTHRAPKVGKGVQIEAPFRCDYGYNLTIGDDVVIDTNCIINDSREVLIGNNTIIGPDVKILGKVYPLPHGERVGALKGRARGFKITIHNEVYIGGGSIIAPSEEYCKTGELIIGPGAWIAPGTVVTKSVPEYTVFGPKVQDQPEVLRPLYSSIEERRSERRVARDMGA
ncbi:trimeric LpxA-like protein [Trichodelitschia bisporula]|uniref:Trimeric LpxA-like protein n=1 Tax=Trichodelitschia bisporula TaxID=703511 RepID=A0A6G1HSW4_9PEZI|nr:trimeric LpxA-like protein [Trichodelitschia bisporula]